MTTFTTETELQACQTIKCVVSLPEYHGRVLSLSIVDNDSKEGTGTFLEKKELFELIETLSLMYKVMKD